MLTRKLTILAATTAIGVAAFAGTASADPKTEPGCRGDATSTRAHEFGGLGHATTTAGFPIAPSDLQESEIRPICDPDPAA
jgi:hypothetical protein